MTDKIVDQNYIKQLKQGDRRVLAQAITLLESTLLEDRSKVEKLLSLLPRGSNAHCIGVTGAPGVGKSTFIEALGLYLVNLGIKVAVLAIDPSSPEEGGAILADKTRMSQLSRHPDAYVRPSATGIGFMGGLTRATGDVIELLEGAGFDVILVETVGVGQNEATVRDFVDQLIYLVSPHPEDEIQAIKRGVKEVADLIVVTKDDQELQLAAEQTALSYASQVYSKVPIRKCSAKENKGIDEVWNVIQQRLMNIKSNRWEKQNMRRFQECLQRAVMENFLNSPEVLKNYPSIVTQIHQGTISPWEATRKLLDLSLRRV